MDGEKDLWRSVLLRAVCDLYGLDLHERRVHKATVQSSAQSWFRSPDLGIGAFRWICSTFELDSTAVRKSVFEEVPKLLNGRVWRFYQRRLNGEISIADDVATVPTPPQDLGPASGRSGAAGCHSVLADQGP